MILILLWCFLSQILKKSFKKGWWRKSNLKGSLAVAIWMFPKIRVPQNGWLISWKTPLKMDDLFLIQKHPTLQSTYAEVSEKKSVLSRHQLSSSRPSTLYWLVGFFTTNPFEKYAKGQKMGIISPRGANFKKIFKSCHHLVIHNIINP